MPIYEFCCQDCGFQFEKLVLGASGQNSMSRVPQNQCGKNDECLFFESRV